MSDQKNQEAFPYILSIPPYIGDEAFTAFLSAHKSPASLAMIRMRFLSVMLCLGDKADIQPVLEDLFEMEMPDITGEAESLAYFQRFLGLWHAIHASLGREPFTLTPAGPATSRADLMALLYRRDEEVVIGFVDGMWDENDEQYLTGAETAALSALEETARTYGVLHMEVSQREGKSLGRPAADILADIVAVDQAVEAMIDTIVNGLRTDPPPHRAKYKRAASLIEDLAHSREFPRETIRECIARREEFVPIFISILTRQQFEFMSIDGRAGALLFIIHILGELRETQAFAPLMELLNGDPDRLEEALGDAVTETLQNILISVYDGNSDRLYEVMNNPKADEYARAAVFEAWTYYVAAGDIDRGEAERYLASRFMRLEPRTDSFVWIAWMEAIARLGFTELSDLVEKALKLELISDNYTSFDSFKAMARTVAGLGDSMAFLADEGLKPFTDTMGVLSEWHSFSEEYPEQQDEAALAKQQRMLASLGPATNPFRNIGRNDPCPCGSGKKYKKCCLQ
ncbi:MAG: DUF1186 domain-containing protein [Proteobacteria bacterium]|nr:DUF1186 domain-containing protein [Pseudomonadota bacterium]